MTDVYSSEKRSEIMACVRATDSKPELTVRQVAHGLGYRFRLHRTDLPGKPDIVFPRHKRVIFVHGCFWHGHKGCPKARRPSSNLAFWDRKLSRNVERDCENKVALKKAGWKVLVIWGCETQDRERLKRRISRFLEEHRDAEG
jgi:DNA mismatch endonuclease, patch repair protein